MPTVPYSPVPSVAPSNQAIGNVEISTPIAAFGGTVAAAIGSVGQAAEHVGGELVTRAIALQNLQNETMAKEEDAKYSIRSGELHAQYNSLRGQDAVAAYPKYIRNLQILRQEHRQALPNDMARRMYDPSSLSVMSRSIFNGANHAATEQRRWSLEASDARITAARNLSAQNPDDPVAFEEAERTIQDEAPSQTQLRGNSPEAAAVRDQANVSSLITDRIESLARTDPYKARTMFEENRGRMVRADINRLEPVVERNLIQQGSRRISEQLNPIPQEGIEGQPLRDRLEQARVLAEEIAPGNAPFATATVERTRVDYEHQRAVLRNDQQNRDNVIIGAINNNNPTTVEQLIATSPEVSGAWDNTPEPRRRVIRNMLAANARGETQPTYEGLQRFNTLRGMAADRPHEFLNVNVMEEYGRGLSRSELNQLSAMQIRLRNAPEQNPQTQIGLRTTRSIWEAAGLSPTGSGRDKYLQFVGAFQDAIQTFQRDNTRVPRGQDEWNLIASQVLQQQNAPNTLLPEGRMWPWNWFGGTERQFERTVPPADLDRFRQDFRTQSEGGREPSDDEVRMFSRKWRARRYQELFGGPATPRAPQSR